MLPEELFLRDLFPRTTMRTVEEVVALILILLQSFILQSMPTVLAGSPLESHQQLHTNDGKCKKEQHKCKGNNA